MNLHKPTGIAKYVENQAAFSIILFLIWNLGYKLVGQCRDSLPTSLA